MKRWWSHHIPAAHTDGDSIVFFRRSDVVATGDIFTPAAIPVIDVANGGTHQGLIDGLNKILDITVPAKYQEGGTMSFPATAACATKPMWWSTATWSPSFATAFRT